MKYMKIGELAKKASVTVRTLQYYHKEGLLSPSAESEGGFRLYTDKDMAKLIQILTMKQLGLTLAEIKERIISLDTPADMVNVLTEHADVIREKIANLKTSLQEIETLKEEVMQMQAIDFEKYAAILAHLQLKNKNYWIIKYLDGEILQFMNNRFGNDRKGITKSIEAMNRLNKEAVSLEKSGVLPNDDRSLRFAKKYWNIVIEITGGDMNMITKIVEAADKGGASGDGKDIMPAREFIGMAMSAYFENMGTDPFEGTNIHD